jgi:hypothetical protein
MRSEKEKITHAQGGEEDYAHLCLKFMVAIAQRTHPLTPQTDKATNMHLLNHGKSCSG